jgi:hypothetical protein
MRIPVIARIALIPRLLILTPPCDIINYNVYIIIYNLTINPVSGSCQTIISENRNGSGYTMPTWTYNPDQTVLTVDAYPTDG